MSKEKPSIPKGTRDFGPAESAKRNYIIEVIKRTFQLFGFSQIETPAMEQLSVLTGKYGEEGDRLLFKILDSGDFLQQVTPEDFEKGSTAVLGKIAEKGLRYDLTVPFARFVVQNRNDITFPFRRYQIQPVWRADKPQKGRYREFYQCDADIIGSNAVFNEAELTNMIHEVFHGLNYQGYQIRINHREVLYSMAAYCGMKEKEIFFCTILDKLDKVGKDKVSEELTGQGADKEKLETLFGLMDGQDDPDQKISQLESVIGSNKGVENLKAYFSMLSTPLPNIQLDFSLARGLNYYTGMIFEVVATDVKIGSICGGGRYDDLTGVFGLPDVSGVGISFGLDRIYDVLEEKGLFPEHLSSNVKLIITHFDETSFHHGIELLKQLRDHGIQSILYPDLAKINKQMTYANKINAVYVVMIGEEEREKKVYTVKHMKTGNQQSLGLTDLIKLLTSE